MFLSCILYSVWLQQVVDDLEDDINDATNSFLENYDPEDFLTFEAQDALDDYVNDTVSTDDIQGTLLACHTILTVLPSYHGV